jgi:hypothetical protein
MYLIRCAMLVLACSFLLVIALPVIMIIGTLYAIGMLGVLIA